MRDMKSIVIEKLKTLAVLLVILLVILCFWEVQ